MGETNNAIRSSLLKAMLPDAKAVAYLMVGLVVGYALGRVVG